MGYNSDSFCINPLNWRTDETVADVSLNKGSVFVNLDFLNRVYNINKVFPRKFALIDPAGIAAEKSEGVADAKIDKKRGTVVTSTYDAFIPDNPIFGDKSCHFEDWSLFFENIKENAEKRIEAFMKQNSK